MKSRHALSLVANEPQRTAEEMLASLVPKLIRAEETVATLRGRIDGWRRHLANERGVAFVREEHVRREFGG